MKPRLPAAPLTYEDSDIWLRIYWRVKVRNLYRVRRAMPGGSARAVDKLLLLADRI